ncbi:hypothetical protein Q8A67_008297 [Cirrhinus molitorella]|uniref:Uncharacterized protein n=1 Tax=Cirrhinus molitorella TaxID=172907 RepID=A0AA88PU34_9TELE|nr:hypothetical protein Q8A67_008297 [Cirrhinus molitorella]
MKITDLSILCSLITQADCTLSRKCHSFLGGCLTRTITADTRRSSSVFQCQQRSSLPGSRDVTDQPSNLIGPPWIKVE